MHKPVKNVVILPADYGQDTARRWPVVYLLHGFRGRYDTWIGKTQPGLPEAASRTGEVIVCPDGGYSSWYWDSPTDPSMRYETYVAEAFTAPGTDAGDGRSPVTAWADTARCTSRCGTRRPSGPAGR